jgi:hypothetical protein
MILSSVLVAVAVGFVQGFVGIATTVTLARPLAALIAADIRTGHAFSDVGLRPRVFGWIAFAIAFAALVVLHIVVLEVILGALSAGNRTARAELGRLYIFAGIAGMALVRLLPALESRIRGVGKKR